MDGVHLHRRAAVGLAVTVTRTCIVAVDLAPDAVSGIAVGSVSGAVIGVRVGMASQRSGEGSGGCREAVC